MSDLPKHFYEVAYTFDEDADAAYISFGHRDAARHGKTVEVTRHVYVDFNEFGRLTGIEVLGEKYLPVGIKADIDRRR